MCLWPQLAVLRGDSKLCVWVYFLVVLRGLHGARDAYWFPERSLVQEVYDFSLYI